MVDVFIASTWSYEFGITKKVAERVSRSSVWIDGSRLARDSDHRKICDDFETAKAWLREATGALVDRAQIRLNIAKKDFAMACSMTVPRESIN